MRKKVAIAYRSPSDCLTSSHQGLGICAINTCKTLNQHRIHAIVWPVINVGTIHENLKKDTAVTHVVIQAPWVPTTSMGILAMQFPHVQFAVNCHSNVGFLQTEPQAITLMLDLLTLEQQSTNIHCSGNSKPFVAWIKDAYQAPCTYLPNLYYVDECASTPRPI